MIDLLIGWLLLFYHLGQAQTQKDQHITLCNIMLQFVGVCTICYLCYLVVTGHCSDCCESVSHRFTAVTYDHEMITDNKLYKWLYLGFGAFYSHTTDT